MHCDGGGLQPRRLAAVARIRGGAGSLAHRLRARLPANAGGTRTTATMCSRRDRPAFGEDWFFALAVVSDSTFEARSVPTPVAAATPPSRGAIDLVGEPGQSAFTQNLVAEFVLYKGDTVFRPPDWEFRFIPVFNLTQRRRSTKRASSKSTRRRTRARTEGFVGIQGLFVDKHLRNVSDRYDFDSLRVGIQPVTADFRGFLFQDSPVGVRLFGTRDNNRWQYNLGWFRRIEKDTNSGLNDITENDLVRGTA